jgi:hypothetical protein
MDEPQIPTPRELWQLAQRVTWGDSPDDPLRMQQRYLELMREHGYIVDCVPGDDSPLFDCGLRGLFDDREGRS